MTTTIASRTLYIIYNADSTLLGKLNYGYRKLSRSSSPGASSSPACAACDITHGGGLSLKESPQWGEAKAEIEKEGFKVEQLHRDEVKTPLKECMKEREERLPIVLAGRDGVFELIMKREELADCKGDPKTLVKMLRGKGVFGETASL